MSSDKEFESLFDDDVDMPKDLIPNVLRQTRKATAQKDTMDLVFVKIWAAMAVLLAPLFARAAKDRAMVQKKSAPETKTKPKVVNISEEITRGGENPSC